MLELYNPTEQKKKTLELSKDKPKDKQFSLYTCGPTVYDEAHIGNLRSYIFADILRRTLKYNHYRVKWVMNITDVDDKTIKRTIDKYGLKSTPKELRKYTDKYLSDFKKDLKAINIPVDSKNITFIRVSDKIKEIKKFIKELMELGYAYKTEDGVYFSIEKYQKKFGDYGNLVGKNFLKGKKVGARVKVDEYEKENLSDFALWKGRDASDGDIFWRDKELGDGRPGWHIECSVINQIAFDNSPTDIHTGGVDLIFPHHTNEIAQSQPFHKPFVRYWAHCEHLLVDGKKMSKSLGNFYTLRDIEEKKDALAFRYLILMSHYRSKLNFTSQSIEAANAGLQSLRDEIHLLSYHLHLRGPNNDNIGKAGNTKTYENLFQKAIDNDLDTPTALSLTRALLKTTSPIKERLNLVKKLEQVLGLNLDKAMKLTPSEVKKIPAEINELAAKREILRGNKQFIKADALRKEIEGLGYILEDTSSGPVVRKNSKFQIPNSK